MSLGCGAEINKSKGFIKFLNKKINVKLFKL